MIRTAIDVFGDAQARANFLLKQRVESAENNPIVKEIMGFIDAASSKGEMGVDIMIHLTPSQLDDINTVYTAYGYSVEYSKEGGLLSISWDMQLQNK